MKFFQGIKLLITLSLISFMIAARYPNRILNVGSRVPTDIPQANINEIDTYFELQKCRMKIDNGRDLWGDCIVDQDIGVEIRIWGPIAVEFPAYMLIPNEYFGFKILLPYAFISNYSESRSGNDLIMNLDFNFQGLINNIKLAGVASGSTLKIAERIRNESSYARNVRNLILTKIDVLTGSIISDNATVAGYSGNYASDVSRVSELNGLVAGLAAEIARKEAEYNSNKQYFDSSNRELANIRLGLNRANNEKTQCQKDKDTLAATKDKLENYSKEYTDEKELNYYNELYAKQCKFLMEAEDLALILPKEKLKVYNIIKELIKMKNFENYKSYFNSDSLFINNMN